MLRKLSDHLHFHKSDGAFYEPVVIAGSAILCHFTPIDRSLWGSSLIRSIPPNLTFMPLKISPLHTRHKVHMSSFRVKTYLFRRHTTNGHILLNLLEFPCLCGTRESCRISVRCPKQNGALQHLGIKIMMDVYQTVLAIISPNYNIF